MPYRYFAVLALMGLGFPLMAAEFSEFPAARIYNGRPAPVDLDTTLDNGFRKRLVKTAAEGPNYAGAYTVVHWECGQHCEVLAILSAETGRVKKVLSTCGGHAFRLYSNLLVVNPKGDGKTYPGHCQTEYYVWQGNDLERLANIP